MGQRERVILRRFDAQAGSMEGKLFRYLNEEPGLMTREAVLRALKAFYLPWALGSTDEVAAARTAIEELQYRIFQIQQRFLAKEVIHFASSFEVVNPQSSNLLHRQQEVEETSSLTLTEMRQSVDPASLEAFLDDF